MGFFGTLFKRKTLQPVNTYGSGEWRSVIQEPYSGAWQKNEELKGVNQVTFHAVFACISLISKDIGKLPLTLKTKKEGVWVDSNTPRRLTKVFAKPNNYQNWQQFNEQWTCSLLLRGNTYVWKKRDAFGNVFELIVLNPDLVKVLVSDNGHVFYQLNTDILAGSEPTILPASEIIHDRINAFYHPLVGLTPITACAIAAGTGESILKNSYGFFKNHSRPSGYLSVDGAIPEEKARKVSSAWNSAYSGENVGKTALLGDGIKYTQITMTATDSQLIEQLQLSARVVCTAFNVPPAKIHLTDSSSVDSVKLNEGYYSDCLQSYIEARENLLDEAFEIKGSGTECFLDIDFLIRMDSLGKVNYYKTGISAGIFSPNEARAKLGYLPTKGGESPMIQQQNYSLEALAKRDAKDDPFSTNSPNNVDTQAQEPADSQKYFEDKYKGVFKTDKEYVKGEFVTHKGSLWYCEKDHLGEFTHDDFKLCVKGK